jgi:metallo-beta-lactamase family protein
LFDLHWIVAENPSRYGTVNFLFDSPAASSMHPILFEGFARTESNGKHGKVRPLWLGKQLFCSLGLDDKEPAHISRALDIVAMTLGLNRQDIRKASALGNDVARAWQPIMHPIKDRGEIFRRGTVSPAVIVVSSGTCDGGPAAAWLPELLGSEKNTIAFSGYCSPASIGGQLLSLKEVPVRERTRCSGHLCWPAGKTFAKSDIKATIEVLSGYSAHADQAGLLEWLFKRYPTDLKLAGRTVFIQHGIDSQRRALSDATKQRAGEVGIPISVIQPSCPDEWFDLDRGGEVLGKEQRRRQLTNEFERIRRELEEMGI